MSDEDKCGACLFLGDDHGDNTCTFRCQLPLGHEGLHQELFTREPYKPIPGTPHNPPRAAGQVTITWEQDERYICTQHGLQKGDDCRICGKELLAYTDAHSCDACFGLGQEHDGKDCPACQGLGYDPQKDPAAFAESLKTRVTLWDYCSARWS